MNRLCILSDVHVSIFDLLVRLTMVHLYMANRSTAWHVLVGWASRWLSLLQDVSIYDETQKNWTVPKGRFTYMIGSSTLAANGRGEFFFH